MKKGCLIGAVVFGVFFLFVIICIGSYFSICNTEVSLRKQFEAQQNVVETTMDKMRKVVMNEGKLTREYADKFIQSVVAQSEGRKGGSGGNFVSAKVVTESNKLGIPTDMYIKLANTIEGNLAEYKNSQDKLTDIWREHNTYCLKMPNRLFIGNYVEQVKKPEMISSSTVKEAIQTKKLDDNLI